MESINYKFCLWEFKNEEETFFLLYLFSFVFVLARFFFYFQRFYGNIHTNTHVCKNNTLVLIAVPLFPDQEVILAYWKIASKQKQKQQQQQQKKRILQV